MSPKEVAMAIGVSEATLKRWCDKGIMPSSRTGGGHRRIPVSGVIEFLRQTGHELVKPELLSLPSNTGRGTKQLEQATGLFVDALQKGDEAQFRKTFYDVYLSGHRAVDICDQCIAQAFHDLGDLWQHGDVEIYQERLGCEICLRLLHEIISILPSPSQCAPLAIGATIEGDPYLIPTTMVEIALREAGWRAQSYGNNLPMVTLASAIRQEKPKLFWLSVSFLEDPDRFTTDWPTLYETADQCGAALVVGGTALREEVRRSICFTSYCDNLKHLLSFASALEH